MNTANIEFYNYVRVFMTEKNIVGLRDITDVPNVGKTAEDLVAGIQRHYVRTLGQDGRHHSGRYQY